MTWSASTPPAAPSTDEIFDGIMRGILQAERDFRQQLQIDLQQAHDLLLAAIRLLAPELVEKRLAQDPFYIDNLQREDWSRLLDEARARFHQRQTEVQLLAGSPKAISRQLDELRRKIKRLEERNQRLRAQLLNHASEPSLPGFPPQPPLPGQVQLPPLPPAPPPAFPVLAGSQSWPRQSQFLALMAVTGWASQRALIEELARRAHISPGAGSLKRLLSGLIKLKLIKKHRLSAAGSTAVMLTLSEFGHQVVAAMGLTVTESEWDRLSRLRPKAAPEHAALICLFAAAARARGYSTQVCSKTETNIPVDIKVQRSTDKPELVFIEPAVEISAQRLQAWRHLARQQGYVALCAANADSRQTLIQIARQAGLAGRATDFESLRMHLHDALWAEQWPAPAMPSPASPAPTPMPSSSSTHVPLAAPRTQT